MVSRAIINGWPLVPPSKAVSAPVFTVQPTISGTFASGNTLTGTLGTATGFPTPTLTGVFTRNGYPIPGATGTTYTLTDADVGQRVDFQVTASSIGGSVSAVATGSTVAQGGGVVPPSFSVAGLPKWSAAVQAGQAGTRDPIVLALGDSKTWGVGSLSSNLSANDKSKSYPTQLAGYKFGGLSAQSAFLSSGQLISLSTAQLAAGDSRFVVGAAGVGNGGSGGESIGGYSLRAATVGENYRFTPVEEVDTFEVWYLRQTTGNGVMGLAVNGGPVTNVSTTGATAYMKATITCPLGVNTLNVSLVSGTRCDVYQIIAYNSAARRVRVYNAGVPGAMVSDIATSVNPQNPLNAFDELDPDLTIIDLGTNEANQSSLPVEATWKGNYQLFINAAIAANSDVLLVVPFPMGSTNGLANQATIRQWILDLAASNSLPFVDLQTRWGSYAAKNALGWYRDTLHATQLGYADVAAAHAAAIGGVAA